jgi:hypothetical protein
MANATWTPSMIEERFVEAADVINRLPDVRVPRILLALAQGPARIRRSGRAGTAPVAAPAPNTCCNQPNGGDALLAAMA